MSHRNLNPCLIVFLMLATACATSAPTPTGTPTPDLAATAQVVEATQAQATADAARTQEAQAAAATQAAEATATQSFALTATPARATEIAAQRQATRQAATAQAVAEATAQAQPMRDVVQQLYAEGYLSSTEGRYYDLRRFDEKWAQLNWYRWFDTDRSPSDFVVRADTWWSSASDKADWWNSGCGFVFRAKDNDNHYLAYLGLDGWVYFSAFRRGNYVDLGGKSYGKVDIPTGEAQLMLVVEGDKFTFFVNGERVYSRVDTMFDSGGLAFTLLSGTNKGYGTWCRMNNVQLWELKRPG